MTKFYLITLITISCILFTVAGWMHLRRIPQIQNELDTLLNEEAFSLTQFPDDELQRRVEMLRRRSAEDALAVPHSDDIGTVLAELAGDLNNLSVSKRSLTTSPAVWVGDVRCVPFEVQFVGTVHDLFSLLVRIDGYPRLVRVDRLEITRDVRRTDRDLNVTLHLMTFDRREKVPA